MHCALERESVTQLWTVWPVREVREQSPSGRLMVDGIGQAKETVMDPGLAVQGA